MKEDGFEKDDRVRYRPSGGLGTVQERVYRPGCGIDDVKVWFDTMDHCRGRVVRCDPDDLELVDQLVLPGMG